MSTPLPRQDPGSPAPRQRDEDWLSLAEWQRRHEALKAQASLGGVDLLLLGDSITEAWPGTGQAAWGEHLLPLKAAAFGIGGDMTQHLLWRLRLGECDGLQPKVVGLLVGINNFGQQDDSPQEVARGVLAVAVEILRRWPRAELVLLGLLPDGDLPRDPLRRRVMAVNARLSDHGLGPQVRFFDVPGLFLKPDGSLDRDLLPDGVHPNGAAYERWARVLAPAFRILLGV